MPLIYMYSKELKIEETTETAFSASFLNIYLEFTTNNHISI
jgi:hypothetical protein